MRPCSGLFSTFSLRSGHGLYALSEYSTRSSRFDRASVG